MAPSTADLGKTKSNTNTSDGAVVTLRPDMRMVKLGSLFPVFVVIVGVAVYMNPLTIDPDYKLAGLMIIATLALAAITGLLLMYEAFGQTVYAVTKDHIREESGIINKKVRLIPLSYIRDVAYDQNFLQAMFGVSSVTVSPTNGNNIVLSNVRTGETVQETIWSLVMSRAPVA